MATQEEIIVKARPEGLEETTEGFEDMEESLDEAKGEMNETAGSFQELTQKWTGALKAITAGLSVAVGGILTQVPILRELFGGLGAVIEGISFQLDKRLRPSLQPIVNGLYELAAAITAGDWGRVEELISNAAQALASLDWGQLLADATNAIAGMVEAIAGRLEEVDWLGLSADVIKAIGNGLATFIQETDWGGIIGGLTDAIVNVIMNTDWVGIGVDIIKGVASGLGDLTGDVASSASDIATEIAGEIVDFSIDIAGKVAGAVGDAVEWVINEGPSKLAEIAGDIAEGIANFEIDFAGIIKDGVDAALSWLEGGVDIITGLGQAVGNMFIDAINDTIPNKISISIPEIDIPHGPTIGGDTISADLPDNPVPKLQEGGSIESEGMAWLHPGEMVVPAADVDRDEEMEGRQSGFMPSQNINANFSIDGRKLDESTGRYGRDGTARRGI